MNKTKKCFQWGGVVEVVTEKVKEKVKEKVTVKVTDKEKVTVKVTDKEKVTVKVTAIMIKTEKEMVIKREEMQEANLTTIKRTK